MGRGIIKKGAYYREGDISKSGASLERGRIKKRRIRREDELMKEEGY